ncbi:class 1 fructose-bisphosphatase [Aquabacterium sp. A7-Y]|uniref:class 1 fructose-bisphosphatase n=1 Tax=Aquabacterium sp. A7-Y TaxID=1349605 RepID=UPI00223D0FE7|nr:class 1 fructose-bisphosphatase [Aquabacterium sp. A7-Y]MCW7538620.1 class 1 fructose-bisphosphatase [Aquabacterium sp. A7-Y]
MSRPDLDVWLVPHPPALAAAVRAVARGCADIAAAARRGALDSLHQATGSGNASGESQTGLDLYADGQLASALAACPAVAGWVSEEQAEPVASPWHARQGEYLVVYDPLDGSSNIEANVGVGSIFSVLSHPLRSAPPSTAAFLQPGLRQRAAGYVLYGPSTVLVLSLGQGVSLFTLDPESGRWLLTREGVTVKPVSSEFAINASNQRFWDKPVQRYVAECVAGESGPRGRDFNMRWIASLVAEVHRIFTRGGVFLYPRDCRQPQRPGRLRLLYEAAPMAFLMQQAGALAVNGSSPLLEVVPDTLHQRVPVILGSREEVERIVRYHADPNENVWWPLFNHRSLFVQPHA